jgi:hypothetical protein
LSYQFVGFRNVVSIHGVLELFGESYKHNRPLAERSF